MQKLKKSQNIGEIRATSQNRIACAKFVTHKLNPQSLIPPFHHHPFISIAIKRSLADPTP